MKSSLAHAKFAVSIFLLAAALPGATSTMAEARTLLRMAYSSISGSAVVPWIAIDKGLFTKYDLDVELIYVAGSQAMQSLLGGTTPIGLQGIEDRKSTRLNSSHMSTSYAVFCL